MCMSMCANVIFIFTTFEFIRPIKWTFGLYLHYSWILDSRSHLFTQFKSNIFEGHSLRRTDTLVLSPC